MSTEHPCILLVEDDLSLRDTLCDFLHDHGFATVTAGTIREGWDMLLNHRPDLCLLDLNLPDGSGGDLLQRMGDARISVRVIVMTAFNLHHQRLQNGCANLVGWMTKPVSPPQLLESVQRALSYGPLPGQTPGRA